MNFPDVLAFLIRDRSWDGLPLGRVKHILHRLHELDQIELLSTSEAGGPAEMMVMWSWLRPEAERRYARHGFEGLKPDDLGTEGRLWLIGLSAPGGAEHLTMALAWAGKNLPSDDAKERFRCLAPIEEQGKPEPVAFVIEGPGRGSIKPVHV